MFIALPKSEIVLFTLNEVRGGGTPLLLSTNVTKTEL
jgi:hypothetical protein